MIPTTTDTTIATNTLFPLNRMAPMTPASATTLPTLMSMPELTMIMNCASVTMPITDTCTSRLVMLRSREERVG